jgi:hypothetical protein
MEMGKGKATGRSGKSARRRRLTYRGWKISLVDPGEDLEAMPVLTIGTTDVMVRREETGQFSAPMLNMFATYPTVEELAKSLIDSSPVFLAQGPEGPAHD